MKLLLNALILMTLYSCAEKNPDHKENPLQDLRTLELPQVKSEQTSQDSLSVPASFKSKNLEITYPNPKQEAKIVFKGDDAQVLYQVMRIKTVSAPKVPAYASQKTKNGTHIRCSEKVNLQAAKFYTCELDIEYANGEVLDSVEPGEFNEKAPVTTYSYAGKVLQLKAKGKSSLNLSGNSALALYSYMEVGEKDVDAKTLMKEGQNYSCTKVSSLNADDKFFCKLTFDHVEGAVN